LVLLLALPHCIGRFVRSRIVLIHGSGLCLFAGIFLSALSLIGLLSVTGKTAYLSLGFLFSAFLLAFLAAHAMDKLK